MSRMYNTRMNIIYLMILRIRTATATMPHPRPFWTNRFLKWNRIFRVHPVYALTPHLWKEWNEALTLKVR